MLDYFTTSGRHLASAEADAGVSHHVALSVVGADRLPDSGYLRAKVVQEGLVRAAGIPYTILRSTQSFELCAGPPTPPPTATSCVSHPALVQPIAVQDIAAALLDIAISAPAGCSVEVAGPVTMRLATLAEQILRAQHDTRRVEPTRSATYYGTQLGDRRSCLAPQRGWGRHGSTTGCGTTSPAGTTIGAHRKGQPVTAPGRARPVAHAID